MDGSPRNHLNRQNPLLKSGPLDPHCTRLRLLLCRISRRIHKQSHRPNPKQKRPLKDPSNNETKIRQQPPKQPKTIHNPNRKNLQKILARLLHHPTIKKSRLFAKMNFQRSPLLSFSFINCSKLISLTLLRFSAYTGSSN